MDIKSLLESAIESLSNNCSIETIMLKAQSIAYILKDDDFKKWINCEQNGYTDDDLLPTYRIIGCQVYLDVYRPFIGSIQNFSFPPGLMGKYDKRLFSMPFHNPLVEIERYSSGVGCIGYFYIKLYSICTKEHIGTNSVQESYADSEHLLLCAVAE